MSLAEKLERDEELRQAFAEREGRLRRLAAELDERRGELEALAGRAAELAAALETRGLEIEQLNRNERDLVRALDVRAREVEDLNERLRGESQGLQTRGEEVEELNGQLAALGKALEARAREVERLNEQLGAQTGALEVRGQEVERLNRQVEAQSGALEERGLEVEGLDRKIRALEHALARRGEEVEELDAALRSRSLEMGRLERELLARLPDAPTPRPARDPSPPAVAARPLAAQSPAAPPPLAAQGVRPGLQAGPPAPVAPGSRPTSQAGSAPPGAPGGRPAPDAVPPSLAARGVGQPPEARSASPAAHRIGPAPGAAPSPAPLDATGPGGPAAPPRPRLGRRRANVAALAWTLARTDVKVRYHGTWAGFLWALLKPVAILAVLMTVFSLMFTATPDYKLRLVLGLILWDYFAEGTRVGLGSLLAKGALLTKMTLPRWIVVLTSQASALLNLTVFVSGFLVYLAAAGRFPPTQALLGFLACLVLLVTGVVGMALAMSVLFLRYRDLNQIWEVVTQAGFFLAPIVYPLELIPSQYRPLLYLWLPTPIVEFARGALIDGRLPGPGAGLALALACLLLLALGIAVFRQRIVRAAEQL